MIDHESRRKAIPPACKAEPCPICRAATGCKFDRAIAYCNSTRRRSHTSGWKSAGQFEQFQVWLHESAIALAPQRKKEPQKKTEKRQQSNSVDDLLAIVDEAVSQGGGWFRSPAGDEYIDIPVDGGQRFVTYPIASRSVKHWLIDEIFKRNGAIAKRDSLQRVVDLVEARAARGTEVHPVFLRVGKFEDKLYLDLARHDGLVVEISSRGWQVTDYCPVRFIRPQTLKPLPVPLAGGDLRDLTRHLNIEPDSLPLAIAWALNALSDPDGDKLLAFLAGPEASGKTTIMRRLKSLVDPTSGNAPRNVPEDRDLAAHVAGRWVITLDNLSTLSADQSDSLCTLSTGGGFTHRKLHTDGDEFTREYKRSGIMTGLVSLLNRPDLASRSVVINCTPPAELVDMAELDAQWETSHPQLLGALLTCLSHSLAVTPIERVNHRISGLSAIAMAVDDALNLEAGTTKAAIERNRREAQEDLIDASPVASAIMRLLERCRQFTGTVKEFLIELEKAEDESTKKSRAWPATPQALRSHLARLQSVLKSQGITQETVGDRTKRGQLYCWSMAGDDAGDDRHPASSPASSPLETPTKQAIAARGDDGDDDKPPIATAPTLTTGDDDRLVPGATVFYIGKAPDSEFDVFARDRGQRLTLIRIDHGMASCRRADGSITTWLPIGDLQQCSATEHEHSEISDSA